MCTDMFRLVQYPRARLHIYYTVVFNYPIQAELFMRSIQENPCLADLVHELMVYLPGEYYIPFVHGMLTKSLRNMHTMVLPLAGTSARSYPPRHHVLVTQFHLTEVLFSLPTSEESTLLYAFRVIWSLRDLQILTVYLSDKAPVATDTLVRRMRSLRRPWSCAKLKVLTVKGHCLPQTMAILPPFPFGMAVEKLCIDLHPDDVPAEYTAWYAVTEQIRHVPLLRELRIHCEAIIRRPTSTVSWENISTKLPLILRALQSPGKLTVLNIMVTGYSEATRDSLLSNLSQSKIDDILRNFPNLAVLCFELPESATGGRDIAWWEGRLFDHLPALRGVLPIVAKITILCSPSAWREDIV